MRRSLSAMPRCSCDPRSRMTASAAEAPLLGQHIPVATFSRGAGVLGIAPPAPKSNVSMRPQPKRPSKKCRPHSCQYVAGPHLYGIGLHSAEKEATQKKNQRTAKPLSRQGHKRCQKLYECVKVLTWHISMTYTTSQPTGTG